jgi:hypothetical protein
MIQKSDSLIKSEYILNIVMASNQTRNDIDCYVGCYQNGREQGFVLWGFIGKNEAIYFCQNRRSDQISVYIGRYSMQSISEEVYKNQRSFDTCEDAAEFIIEKAVEYSRRE